MGAVGVVTDGERCDNLVGVGAAESVGTEEMVDSLGAAIVVA